MGVEQGVREVHRTRQAARRDYAALPVAAAQALPDAAELSFGVELQEHERRPSLVPQVGHLAAELQPAFLRLHREPVEREPVSSRQQRGVDVRVHLTRGEHPVRHRQHQATDVEAALQRALRTVLVPTLIAQVTAHFRQSARPDARNQGRGVHLDGAGCFESGTAVRAGEQYAARLDGGVQTQGG